LPEPYLDFHDKEEVTNLEMVAQKVDVQAQRRKVRFSKGQRIEQTDELIPRGE
jgi:hypothetical protein